MKNLVFVVTALISTAALAAGGGHGEGVPLKEVGVQALNLGILLAVMIYFMRAPIKEMFLNRQADFKAQAEKTAAALKEAELALADIKNKMNTLESTEQSSYDTAKVEAEKLKNKIIEESQYQATKMKQDVEQVAAAELYKAKSEIRSSMIDTAISSTKAALTAQGDAVTKKSEKNFVSDISKTKGQVTL